MEIGPDYVHTYASPQINLYANGSTIWFQDQQMPNAAYETHCYAGMGDVRSADDGSGGTFNFRLVASNNWPGISQDDCFAQYEDVAGAVTGLLPMGSVDGCTASTMSPPPPTAPGLPVFTVGAFSPPPECTLGTLLPAWLQGTLVAGDAAAATQNVTLTDSYTFLSSLVTFQLPSGDTVSSVKLTSRCYDNVMASPAAADAYTVSAWDEQTQGLRCTLYVRSGPGVQVYTMQDTSQSGASQALADQIQTDRQARSSSGSGWRR
jgi:hypothetical protein